MSELLRSLLIVNPAAGPAWRRGQNRLGQLCEALADRGFEVEVRTTEAPGHAARIAREAVARGAAAVFALGGDGTQREVATGLLGSEVPLGLLAAGTANVLPPALGLPKDALSAARRFGVERGRARCRALDVGICRSGGDPQEHPFLMMASSGVDARTLRRVRPAIKRRFGMLGIALTGLAECLARGAAAFPYEADGELGEASFLSVQNIPTYGGAVRLAAGADPFDGRLDLVVFLGQGRAATLGFAAAALLRRHQRLHSVRIRPVVRTVLRGSGPVALQLDGDPIELTLPVELVCGDQRLLVLTATDTAPRAERSAA